jgi:uncharacterized membrane protein
VHSQKQVGLKLVNVLTRERFASFQPSSDSAKHKVVRTKNLLRFSISYFTLAGILFALIVFIHQRHIEPRASIWVFVAAGALCSIIGNHYRKRYLRRLEKRARNPEEIYR